MRNYTVYFRVGGKKMKATVLAESPEDAKKKLVTFDRVDVAKEEFNQCMDMMDEIINILDKKKPK